MPSSSSPQGVISIYYHHPLPSALFSLGWVSCWQPLILRVQQEGDYSLQGHGSGQVKLLALGKWGWGQSQGPLSPLKPWGAPLDGMRRGLGGMETVRLGALLTVKHIGTQSRKNPKS